MKKPISKNLHRLIDYSYALTVPLLPELVGFEDKTDAKILCRGLGAGALAYTLLTKARWGLFPVLPFKTHLLIDLTVSCFAIAAPFIFEFSKRSAARNTLLAVGAIGLTASLLTDTKGRPNGNERYMFI